MASVSSLVIRRYVSALLAEAGDEPAARTKLGIAVQEFSKLIAESNDFRYVLTNPLIPVVDQERAVAAVLDRGRFDDTFSGFVRVVLRHRRGAMMTDILRAVQSEMDKRAGIVDVRVDVATPMTDGQQKQLVDILSRKTGGTVRLNTRVANDVIAGIRVRYNDVMIDDTVSGKLARLKQALRAG